MEEPGDSRPLGGGGGPMYCGCSLSGESPSLTGRSRHPLNAHPVMHVRPSQTCCPGTTASPLATGGSLNPVLG